ncbi:galactonate dehydratase, partial [Nocardia sp. NPDC004722]
MFLRIDTDEGISGWGEPIVEGRAEAVRAAVDTFMEYLIGRDAGRIEEHWQILTKGGFYRGGPVMSSAVAGIDHALWDIKGKALGVPVYELLGGPVRDKVRIYTWLQGQTPETLAADGREKAAMGFTAAKFCPFEVTPHIPSAAQVRHIVDRVD